MRYLCALALIGVLVLSACSAGKGMGGGNSRRYVAVIDARSDRTGGWVHVIDSVEHKVVAKLERTAPDAVFTGDGASLLVGSTQGLEWIDGKDWQPVRRMTTAFHEWTNFLPDMSAYALSPDGQRLLGLVYHPDGPGPDGQGRLAVQSVDLKAAKVLPGAVEVRPCVGHLLVPAPDRAWLVCWSGPLTELDLAAGKVGRTVGVGPVSYRNGVPYGGGEGWASTFAGEWIWPDTAHALLLTAKGAVLQVTPAKGDIQQLGALHLPAGQRIPHRQAVLSADGKLLYVGTSGGNDCASGCQLPELEASLLADTVRVYSTRDWRVVHEFKVETPFYDLALSAGDRQLVTTSPSTQRVSFLAAATGRELAVVGSVGQQPSLIVH